MDKVPDYDSGDRGFESHNGEVFVKFYFEYWSYYLTIFTFY